MRRCSCQTTCASGAARGIESWPKALRLNSQRGRSTVSTVPNFHTSHKSAPYVLSVLCEPGVYNRADSRHGFKFVPYTSLLRPYLFLLR
jgi:hypothetical protein